MKNNEETLTFVHFVKTFLKKKKNKKIKLKRLKRSTHSQSNLINFNKSRGVRTCAGGLVHITDTHFTDRYILPTGTFYQTLILPTLILILPTLAVFITISLPNLVMKIKIQKNLFFTIIYIVKFICTWKIFNKQITKKLHVNQKLFTLIYTYLISRHV
jgi:hypothetical protein